MSEDRKKVWIDPFQTQLSNRIAAYLAVFFVVFVNLLFGWRLIAEGPVDPWRQFIETLYANLPVFIVLLFLVPVLAWDTIRMSHRLVGPLVRFRKTMEAIADGEPVRPIKLRDGDYLTDLRDEFNRMLESLQKRGVPVMMPVDPAKEEDAPKKTA
jgi:methyl-accepting chemotaxis protein